MQPTSQPKVLCIGVLSDTHNRLPYSVVDRLRHCDQLWHLGDVCDPTTLSALETLNIPLTIVRGNCDHHSAWPLSRDWHLNGKIFTLIHIPPTLPPAGKDFLLHGHTHVPQDKFIAGCRYLNPGCISRANRGAPASFAFLHIDPEGQVNWQLVPV